MSRQRMAGQRVSASAVQPGSNVLQVGRDVADRPFEAEIHEYKLAGADTSVWVRFVEIRSTMPGPSAQ